MYNAKVMVFFSQYFVKSISNSSTFKADMNIANPLYSTCPLTPFKIFTHVFLQIHYNLSRCAFFFTYSLPYTVLPWIYVYFYVWWYLNNYFLLFISYIWFSTQIHFALLVFLFYLHYFLLCSSYCPFFSLGCYLYFTFFQNIFYFTNWLKLSLKLYLICYITLPMTLISTITFPTSRYSICEFSC